MTKQVRMLQATEMRATQSDDGMVLEGYAATFDAPTVLFKVEDREYKEVIDRRAFDGANMKDCCLKYNHSDHYPILARTRGGSLELSVDNQGLFFRAKLFNTQSSKDVYELVKEGALDRCSFAFTINTSGDTYDRETRTRTITSIDKLFDVSVVDIPAYDSTSVHARSFFESEDEKEIQALESAERRKRLLLRTKM